MTSRCRTGRSVRGFRLPPCVSFEERRELEKVIVKGLLSLESDLKGDYFPLHGSRSYADKPEGMSLEKEEELRSNGNLFQEPDSTLLLSGGMGRHWPDARGIFHNNDANMFVWVNEEDQMRIVSMEKGDDIKRIITRFSNATAQIQKVLKENGKNPKITPKPRFIELFDSSKTSISRKPRITENLNSPKTSTLILHF